MRPWWDSSAALGDGCARGVPQDARVVPVAVDLEHGADDILNTAAVVDDATEVAEILLAGADVLWQVSRTDSLAPRDHDLWLKRSDSVKAGDPRFAALLVGLGCEHVHAVVDDIACYHSRSGRNVEDC